MQFANLEQCAEDSLRAEGRKVEQYRWAWKKFREINDLQSSSQCEDRWFSDECFKHTRALGESTGAIGKRTSASFGSRLKILASLWRQKQDLQSGKTFSAILSEVIEKSGLSASAFARENGVGAAVLLSWSKSRRTPSCNQLPTIRSMDERYCVNGRLVASLSKITLRPNRAEVFNANHALALEKGEGSVHQVFRYWSRNLKERLPHLKGRRDLFRASKLRLTLWRRLDHIDETNFKLWPNDREPFVWMDDALEARGALLVAFENALRNNSTDPVVLQHRYADWSETLKKDFEEFYEYKTQNLADIPMRSTDAVWTTYVDDQGSEVCHSKNTVLKRLEFIFGYIVRSKMIRGDSLRLAHAILPEFVIGERKALMRRTRRSHLNDGDKSVLGTVRSLIRPMEKEITTKKLVCGFMLNEVVAQKYLGDEFILSRLPLQYQEDEIGWGINAGEVIDLNPEDRYKRWCVLLMTSWKSFDEFQGSRTHKSGDLAGPFRQVIRSGRDLRQWFVEGFAKLVATPPPRHSSPVSWAIRIRWCLLYLFLATRGFRRTTQYRLAIEHVRYDQTKKTYRFEFPGGLLKTRASDDVIAEIEDDIMADFDGAGSTLLPANSTALIDLWLNEARPILVERGKIRPGSKSFFGWGSVSALGFACRSMCVFALGIRGQPHGFRYCIATLCKRLGIRPEEAADILLHLPAMSEQIYNMSTAADKGVRANKTVRKMFRLEKESEAVAS